ncbi:MBL fold metallo-hydrolase [Roseomonas sp. USHLN139]|uniref:MBL fold metallo-hydrolase n=1 Tax=Roseomonas sp. USHLN139 TaxID=3081298 RepID=UPI003B024739
MTQIRPEIAGFHDPRTGSIQYIVSDPGSGRAAVIDPVLDFDPASGATATASADVLLAHLAARGLTLDWIIDTHPHADHFSAAGYLQERTGKPIVTGGRVVEVQALWKRIYNLGEGFAADGSQWDRLLEEGESLPLGGLSLTAMHSPGHTLASMTLSCGDAAFIHDTLFMPDSGSARADFPGGSAAALWRSIQRIMALPETTRLFTGHDYRPKGREAVWESTVAEQRATNIHLTRASCEAEFVAIREARDRTLPMPKLILAALQVNIAGGRLPAPEASGQRFLKIPLNGLPGAVWG